MYCSESCRENATEERHLNKLGSTNNVIGMDCGLFSRIASRMECDTVESNGGCISNVKELFCENELHPKTVFDFDFSDSDEIIKNEKNHLLAMFSLIDKVNFAILDNDDVEIYFSDYARRIAEEFTFLTLAHKTDGIFLFGSLLNHSCAPNIVVYQFEEKNVYMVIRPITEGQQLFISYG